MVKSILAQASGEILLTFMYEEINRFIGHPEQPSNFNMLFGTDEWKKCVALTGARERSECLHGLYLRQLKSFAKHARSFQMRNAANNIDYFLFYATGSDLGLRKMKEAMWKVDKSGAFSFSDATDTRQSVLFGDKPDLGRLRHQILQRFRGKETTAGRVEEFVLTETAFCKTHCKSILKALEKSDPPGLMVPNPPPGRRQGTYARHNLRLKFA